MARRKKPGPKPGSKRKAATPETPEISPELQASVDQFRETLAQAIQSGIPGPVEIFNLLRSLAGAQTFNLEVNSVKLLIDAAQAAANAGDGVYAAELLKLSKVTFRSLVVDEPILPAPVERQITHSEPIPSVPGTPEPGAV